MKTWSQVFEQIVVPMTGLALIVLAALGGPVPPGLYPVLAGLVGYPIAREVDRRRRQASAESGSK